jgi:hypothetical protein
VLVKLATQNGSMLTSFDLPFDGGTYPAALVYDGCVFVHGPERRQRGLEGEYFHLPSVTVESVPADVINEMINEEM